MQQTLSKVNPCSSWSWAWPSSAPACYCFCCCCFVAVVVVVVIVILVVAVIIIVVVTVDIVVSLFVFVINVYPRNLHLKFGQNRVTNSWDIVFYVNPNFCYGRLSWVGFETILFQASSRFKRGNKSLLVLKLRIFLGWVKINCNCNILLGQPRTKPDEYMAVNDYSTLWFIARSQDFSWKN